MIDVFYKEMPSSLLESATAFPLRKFGLVHEDWKKRFGNLLTFPDFDAATPDHLKLVHDPDFVDGILDGRIRNSISGPDPSGAMSACWDVGAFLAAARNTSAFGRPSACIAAGFHHAGYRRAHAFCTFNGLMVAASVLREEGHSGRIGILDLDAHFGDGTQSIIDQHRLTRSVEHYSFAHQMLDRDEVDGWLDGLAAVIELFHRSEVTILFYYAGVDPHQGDPMVRGVITTEQMRRRERIVFETCKALSLPICWVLAGGYQKPLEKVVELHRMSMEECLRSLGVQFEA